MIFSKVLKNYMDFSLISKLINIMKIIKIVFKCSEIQILKEIYVSFKTK